MPRKKSVSRISLLKKDGSALKRKKKAKKAGRRLINRPLTEHQQKLKIVLAHSQKMISMLRTLMNIPFSGQQHDYKQKWFFRHYNHYKKTGALELKKTTCSICNLNHLAPFKAMLPFKMEISDTGNGIISVIIKDRLISPLELVPPETEIINLKLVAMASGFGESEDGLVSCSQSVNFNYHALTDQNIEFNPRKIHLITGAKPGNIVVIAATLSFEGLLPNIHYKHAVYMAGALLTMGKLKSI